MSPINGAASRYNLRQYELMLDRLEAHRRGAISLRRLIQDLRSLVEALELPSSAWKDEFVGEWWTLEQVYAVAIDRNELDHLPTESQELVDTAIASLRDMVVGAMSSTRNAAGPG